MFLQSSAPRPSTGQPGCQDTLAGCEGWRPGAKIRPFSSRVASSDSNTACIRCIVEPSCPIVELSVSTIPMNHSNFEHLDSRENRNTPDNRIESERRLRATKIESSLSFCAAHSHCALRTHWIRDTHTHTHRFGRRPERSGARLQSRIRTHIGRSAAHLQAFISIIAIAIRLFFFSLLLLPSSSLDIIAAYYCSIFAKSAQIAAPAQQATHRKPHWPPLVSFGQRAGTRQQQQWHKCSTC